MRERDRRFVGDRRAVSTTLGYVITLTLSAILISGLLTAGASLVQDERAVVATDQLDVAGEQLATGILDADRLAATAPNGSVRVRVWLPERAGNAAYSIRIVQQSTPADQPYAATLVVASSAIDVSTNTTVRSTFELAETTVDGGPVAISLQNTDGDTARELLIEDADEVAALVPLPVGDLGVLA